MCSFSFLAIEKRRSMNEVGLLPTLLSSSSLLCPPCVLQPSNFWGYFGAGVVEVAKRFDAFDVGVVPLMTAGPRDWDR